MRRLILVLATGLLVAACGGAAAGAGVAAPPVPSSPAATAAAGPASAAELAAVAEAVFPNIQDYSYYGVCGVTGDVADCPYTDGLKARLTDLKQTLLRAQNPSPTREIAAWPTATGGVARVTLFGGRQAVDLVIVRQGDQLLVADETCAGRPETSIYADFTAC